MDLIKNFKQISKTDNLIAGGKGASLGEMIHAGIPVPHGFVILSNAFDKFIADSNVEIGTVLDEVEIKRINTVEIASKKIKAIIMSKEMPYGIKNEILKNYKKLNQKFVAVRSSATSEDSTHATWAGQLDSFLNITGDMLIEHVKKCWASLFNPRAIFYRFENKLNNDKISVAVVVQRMVESEKSGIAFSAHPTTQDRGQIIIEAGFGLGEAVASGSITPDSYVVDKQGFNILDINVNKQTKALYKKTTGGNEWKLLGEKGNGPVLTKKDIIKLSKLIVKIENHYGFPCDIEWAKEKDRFYILQSRPITTLTKFEGATKRFEKRYTRPLPLNCVQYWWESDYYVLPKFVNGVTRFNPLFIHKKNKAVDVYYVFNNDKEFSFPLINYFKQNPKKFNRLARTYQKDCRKLLELCRNKKEWDFLKIYNFILKKVWPMLTITMILGNLVGEKSIIKNIAKRACQLRKKNEKVVYEAGSALYNIAGEKFPKLHNCLDYLTREEITSGKAPSIYELNDRVKGFIYFEGNLYTKKTIEQLEKEKNLVIIEKKSDRKTGIGIIRGASAMKGHAIGKVKLLFEIHQIEKVKEGDIIVSPMTIPDFLPAMEKASAFITDEGGILCHAAIIAREMKKPCIFGTKIATKILKDGDLVEINSNDGIVKILKKIRN